MIAMVVVVVLGIALVVACLALLFLPYGNRYKTSTQKFSGFGINLEISLLTVLAMLGVAMSLIPVVIPLYQQMRQLSKQLEDASRDREAALSAAETMKRQLDKAQKIDVWALVTLEGVTEQTRPQLGHLQCTYSLTGEQEPVRAAITYGVRSNQLRVLLVDVDRGTVVERLVIEEPGERRWSYDRFVPMEPTFELKREK